MEVQLENGVGDLGCLVVMEGLVGELVVVGEGAVGTGGGGSVLEVAQVAEAHTP